MKAKKIAWVGGQYFWPEVKAMGHDVTHCSLTKHPIWTWDEIVAYLGGEPDMVVYGDKSQQPPLPDIEKFPCHTVFYCIDSHIHSWYPMYAQGFDLAAVSLRDHLPRFRQRLDDDQVLWLPPYPIGREQPPTDPPKKEWDLLFAGKVDPETSPKRSAFLKELTARFPNLEVREGVFGELFPRARVVLNYAERNDLNFRVFEALACESCLVTPEVGHGLTTLFENGTHLATYPQDNMDRLIDIVCGLLADSDRREAMAQAGLAEINAKHRAEHRAETLMKAIDRLDDSLIEKRLAAARSIHSKYMKLVYLHWAEACGDSDLGRTYLAAATKS